MLQGKRAGGKLVLGHLCVVRTALLRCDHKKRRGDEGNSQTGGGRAKEGELLTNWYNQGLKLHMLMR